jgi:hypothetical protein
MRKIYYKEGKDIKTKKEYLFSFFPNESDRYFKATYYVDNDRIQCYPTKGRSFMDIYWLMKSKFKTITKGELARMLLDKRNSNIRIYYCDEIKKLTITHDPYGYSGITSFINSGDYSSVYLNKDYLKHGPSFGQIVKLALKSKKFTLNDIPLNENFFTRRIVFNS